VSARYLLDTNVLSEPIKSAPNARVLAALERNEGALATCSIVWHELRYGCDRLPASRRRAAIAAYLDEVVRLSLTIIPYDEAAAAWHAGERTRLARRGIHTGWADAQIAAIAAVNDLVLVTANVRDFAKFTGLDVEDWS
jgi:tRNA(fMet)-specific endonuclease VapC